MSCFNIFGIIHLIVTMLQPERLFWHSGAGFRAQSKAIIHDAP
jgi:hypothetical protein